MNIEHIALWCRNIEAMKAFYKKYFNARASDKYINPAKGFSSYFLDFESGARLEIMEMSSIPESRNNPYDQSTGYIHLAISVGSQAEVEALTARMGEDGYEILDGPRRTGDGCFESVVLDPENNRIEITV